MKTLIILLCFVFVFSVGCIDEQGMREAYFDAGMTCAMEAIRIKMLKGKYSMDIQEIKKKVYQIRKRCRDSDPVRQGMTPPNDTTLLELQRISA